MKITFFVKNAGEKPLDTILDDGGFCSIFRTIACIGDSLSSGEFESINEYGENTYHDFYEYSWGQYIARMTGAFVYNFSRGGMTAKEYCKSFADCNDFWNKDKASQAYIVALGLNDLFGEGQELGTVNDICLNDYTKNNNTFAGFYGQIIQRLKNISPDARFFFVTFAKEPEHDPVIALGHRQLMYDLTKLFKNSYVIDLYQFGPVYDDKFKENFYLLGHMTPTGYILTAKIIASYIDYIIRNNPTDFKKIGFINTGIEEGF
jgi:hypothetical protein